MKRIFIIIGKAILAFIIFMVLYVIVALTLPKLCFEREEGTKEEVAIYIKTNGVHTDIVVPAVNDQMDWRKEILYSNTSGNDTSMQYLAMGWGDKGFYLETPTWSDLKASVAFKAAFALSTTAIHATYHSEMKLDSSCKKIMISREQYARLISYISESFLKSDDGHFVYIKTNANYSTTDAFYEATGKYSLLHTCNTWANNGLKACGQKCCVWTPRDVGIFEKYN
jgi:uncharacterized protein (TIGR02117 family)